LDAPGDPLLDDAAAKIGVDQATGRALIACLGLLSAIRFRRA
jgi:hypothetical protein